jgi:hypothetical protein
LLRVVWQIQSEFGEAGGEADLTHATWLR